MTKPYYCADNIVLYHGDLREVLPQTVQPNTVDFVVTDPPYGLGFMEKDWDFNVPGPTYWKTIAAACKPGALLLAFGGTRTWHRLVGAVEDAGWEIRDCLMWLYGQGMPKCGDIGKMIDKSKGAKREVVGSKLDRPGYHLHENKGGSCYGGGKGLHAPGTDARLRASQITAPATPEATQFTGFAMALKPAWEPIVLAMKQMDGTIAHNALTWGVAGLNIDATRIACDGGSPSQQRREGKVPAGNYNGWNVPSRNGYNDRRPGEALGRWPTNVLLDDEAAVLLDKQRGRADDVQTGNMQTGNSDGVSRFFYCSKACRRERNPKGMKNDHPTVKPLALMEYLLTLLSTPTGGVILDPFAGSGTTLIAAKKLGRPCIGVELDAHNCEIAKARISQATV
jgi:site-specific DNA-methyltransferase (adenine-specific)